MILAKLKQKYLEEEKQTTMNTTFQVGLNNVNSSMYARGPAGKTVARSKEKSPQLFGSFNGANRAKSPSDLETGREYERERNESFITAPAENT